ncbi:MAG: glycine--tRNA ligase subunit beta [Pseudomonadota bacterium]|nr:glycine--tRNA ligase subunit beta [Pseudomonadota bacterium]
MPERNALLLEIGTEELPPRALPLLSKALEEGLLGEFDRAGLTYGGARRFATPRRLAVRLENLSSQQPDQFIERKGPALAAAFDKHGAPSKAAEGFARSCGVDVASLQRVETKRGARLYYRLTRPGEATRSLLPAMVAGVLANLPISKRMRWGAGEAEFVRPVHWIVLLFGEEVVDANILGVRTGRQTAGHRFHHPGSLVIAAPAQYEVLLEAQGKVLADFDLRRARIRQQVEGLADTLHGRGVIDEALLDEVTALVEWPQALTGDFDPQFLEMPPEVLITTMQGNQRYFPVVSPAAKLLPHFIAVSNVESQAPEVVRAGNERVLRPRFNDAAFFWRQDRKIKLESRREALKNVVFQERLGSLFDKTARTERLATFIASRLAMNVDQARRAAVLSKCDLVTDMVFEFPDLQGIMGRYYAAYDGEPDAVAIALDEQYMPRHAGDALPCTPIGQVLALADRLDTLIGIFAVGYRPTGEKDPYGLRRAALGVLRLVIERELELDLEIALREAASGLPAPLDAAQAIPDTFDYIMERLKTYYSERGIAPDVFNAVDACRPTRPLDFDRRVRAVQVFRELPEAQRLIGANKRIVNILRQATEAVPRALDEALLQESAERELYRQVETARRKVEPLFEQGHYRQALTELASLRAVVDRFFDEVMVMSDDKQLKSNRIALLQQVSDLFLRSADISRLQ